MRRLAFHLLAAVSLLLCIAACALWGRSYWRTDGIIMIWKPLGSHRIVAITSSEGLVSALVNSNETIEERAWPSIHYNDGLLCHFIVLAATEAKHGWGCARDGDELGALAPMGAFAAAFALLPALAIVGFIRRRGGGVLRCPACGYDLRASPGRCPECGREQRSQPA